MGTTNETSLTNRERKSLYKEIQYLANQAQENHKYIDRLERENMRLRIQRNQTRRWSALWKRVAKKHRESNRCMKLLWLELYHRIRNSGPDFEKFLGKKR